MYTVATRIRDFHRDRDPSLVAHKYAVMRGDPFTFLRGTCHLFYADWPATPPLDAAPLAWITGDLHVENVGTYKGDNRLTYFDLNDFDEAILAPGVWDIARLLASILVGAEQWHLGEEDALTLVREVRDIYCAELRAGKARWIERETARGAVRRLLAQVTSRSRPALLDHYTRRVKRRRWLVPDGRKLLPVSVPDRLRAEQVVQGVAAARSQAGQDDADVFFEVHDVAQRVAGVGSLGVTRYAVLVHGHGSPDGNVLLDVKQATPSALAPVVRVTQPEWRNEAERIVHVQTRAVAIAPALLHAVTVEDTSYVVRELQPVADRLQLARWAGRPKKLREAFTLMARLAAWATDRTSGWHTAAPADAWAAFAARDDWQAPLLQRVRDLAAQTLTAYQEFVEAYDDGAFGPPDTASKEANIGG